MNNKGADQSARLRRLINAFVVRCGSFSFFLSFFFFFFFFFFLNEKLHTSLSGGQNAFSEVYKFLLVFVISELFSPLIIRSCLLGHSTVHMGHVVRGSRKKFCH